MSPPSAMQPSPTMVEEVEVRIKARAQRLCSMVSCAAADSASSMPHSVGQLFQGLAGGSTASARVASRQAAAKHHLQEARLALHRQLSDAASLLSNLTQTLEFMLDWTQEMVVSRLDTLDQVCVTDISGCV